MSGSASITDVRLLLPAWSEVLDVLFLRSGFNTSLVIIGTSLLGFSAGVVGSFTLLRKRALVGDALAHAALPGLAAAFLFSHALGVSGKSLVWLLSGAALSAITAVLLIQFITRFTRLREDSAIGAVLSVFFGFGVVLISVIQNLGSGDEGGLHHFIYGQTAAMQIGDAYLTLLVAALSFLLCLSFFKEFRSVCFDAQFAATQGWPVTLIDLLMMSLLILVTLVGLQSVGIILVVALLIVPAAAARFWTESLFWMVMIAALIGALSGYIGSALSALFPRMPAGAVIVLSCGVLFLVSFFFAPRRGVIASSLRLSALRYKVAREHLLREMHELLELRADADLFKALHFSDLRTLRSANFLKLRSLLSWLQFKGYLKVFWQKRALCLSAAGLASAQKLTRNHRLWEQYLLNYSSLSASHVDPSADLAEHVLSPQIVAELEARMSAKHKLPEMLGSPHPLGTK